MRMSRVAYALVGKQSANLVLGRGILHILD